MKIKVTQFEINMYTTQFRYWSETGAFLGMCERFLWNNKWYPAFDDVKNECCGRCIPGMDECILDIERAERSIDAALIPPK